MENNSKIHKGPVLSKRKLQSNLHFFILLGVCLTYVYIRTEQIPLDVLLNPSLRYERAANPTITPSDYRNPFCGECSRTPRREHANAKRLHCYCVNRFSININLHL